MIRYFGLSVLLHLAAAAVVFTAVEPAHTDVVQNAGVIMVNWRGAVDSGTREQGVQSEHLVSEVLPTQTPLMPIEGAQAFDSPIPHRKLPPYSQNTKIDHVKAHLGYLPAVESSVEEKSSKQSMEPPKHAVSSPEVEVVNESTVAEALPAKSQSGVAKNIKAINLKCPAPPYPSRARRRGLEGVVRLVVRIGEDGRVQQVNVINSSGRKDMDDAAKKTVLKRWSYLPAQQWGHAVASQEVVQIQFRLDGV